MDGGHARQQHGMDFENWLKETFFQSYTQPGYTDKWDATAVVFKEQYIQYTGGFQNLPISIKTCKYRAPINFGDAIRQFENLLDFLLIVGFWMPGGGGKKFVSVKGVRISALDWNNLFRGKVTPDELEKDQLDSEAVKDKIYKLDRVIKTTPFYKEARLLARQKKAELPTMDIVLNPKIDSKNQRRLQCSLPFQVFWTNFAKEQPFPNVGNCTFWGEQVPNLK